MAPWVNQNSKQIISFDQKKSTFEELDFRWGKTDYSLFLSETEIESFSCEFNSKIEICNKVLKDDLDWWFTPISARNNFSSPLFHHFLCFKISIKLAKYKTFPDKSFTDCDTLFYGLKKLQSYGKWHGEITHTRKFTKLGMFLKRFKAFIRVLNCVLTPFFLSRVLFRPKKTTPKFSSLIDTFSLPGKELSDRYYSGICDFLNEKEKAQIRFVPTFHGYSIETYYSAIRKLRSKSEKFLLKEDFLTIFDLFWSLMHSIRLFFLKVPRLPLGPFDFGRLINEEIGRFGCLEDGVCGFINFCFARRLKEAKINMNCVVDWHENQGQDRGWNYGFHTFYPEIKMIGYNMVSLSKWHLAISPLPSERKKKVLPKVILTPSIYLVNIIKKNDPRICVKVTGAFRFPSPRKRIPNAMYLRILVPLSINSDAAFNSTSKIRTLIDDLNINSKVKFTITFKPHPAISNTTLANLTKNDSSVKEIWSNRSLSEELSMADLVLGEWTFALLESLNAGLTVGIIRSRDGLFHSSIPLGAGSDRSLNIDSSKVFKKLIKIALRRRSSEQFLKKPILEIPTRILALKVFGLR